MCFFRSGFPDSTSTSRIKRSVNLTEGGGPPFKCTNISILNAFFLDIPFFQAHGETDNILPLQYGINTSKILKQFLTKHEVSLIFTYKYLIDN